MAGILIGLALFNGGPHIGAQLESIAAQTFQKWRLVVSDDGSVDRGPAIVRQFASRFGQGRVILVDGPSRGATQNFLSLLAYSRPGEYLAFCDQDDVWSARKMEFAIDALTGDPEAGLYSARTTICDENLRPLGGSRRYKGPYDFRNALIQAVTGGNTCVLNPRAAEIARRAAPHAVAAAIEAHDWWLYQIISGAGMDVLRDDKEVLLYRQHRSNLKGRNDTLAAMRLRIGQLFDGQYGAWLAANVHALLGAADCLTAENLSILRQFGKALDLPGPRAAAAFANLKLARQTPAGTAAFFAAAASGRLRRS